MFAHHHIVLIYWTEFLPQKRILSVGFLSLILYLGCMLSQAFFYCWYGNELHLKSKTIGEAIYSNNWTIATPRDRRSLFFVMTISQKGLKLSYYGIFSLALDTFTWILKTSYSAFNVLQQASVWSDLTHKKNYTFLHIWQLYIWFLFRYPCISEIYIKIFWSRIFFFHIMNILRRIK